jgi:hypothetical protein
LILLGSRFFYLTSWKGDKFMVCYHPVKAYRSTSGRDKATGKWPIVFNRRDGYEDLFFELPCGQCIGCKLERSRQWAIRCVHEAQMHKDNCFLTLTYDDDHLDPSGSLEKRDFPLFMKRLRNHKGDGIRFMHCAEYGELLNRPHHHAIIFNFDFDDKVLFSQKRGVRLYTSKTLEDLWPHGFSMIGDVNFETAAYVARYTVKKITGPMAEAHYQGRLPEYLTMSRRPGIAFDWFQRYKSDIFPDDFVVIRGGIKCRPAKYYDELYDRMNHGELSRIKIKRVEKAKAYAKDITPKRLRVREKVQQLKSKKLIRPIE